MHRKQRSDAAFDDLCDQRDHWAIQVSLASDIEPADLVRLSVLQRELRALDRKIFNHKPAGTSDSIAVGNRSH